MDCGDGKRGWLSHREGQKGASPNKEKPQIGRRDIQCNTGIGVNSTGFLAAKFISWLVFWFMLKVMFVIGSAVDRLCG